MKIITTGYLDFGVSIGIDDEPFNDTLKLNQFRNMVKENITYPVTAPEEIFPLIGCGIDISLNKSRISKKWFKDTLKSLHNNKPMSILKKASLSDCNLTIYSIGIIYFTLSIDGITGNDLSALDEISNSCDMSDDFAAYLKDIGKRCISCFGGKKDSLESISHRYNISESSDEYLMHLVMNPSILLCDTDISDSKFENISLKINNTDNKLRERDDDYIIEYGHYFLIRPEISEDDGYSYDANRILYLIKLGSVFDCINATFEQLFVEEMRNTLKSSFNTKIQTRDARYLNQCRMLAALIIDITTPETISLWASDARVLKLTEKESCLNAQKERIKSTVEVFKEVQAEMNSIEDSRRDKKLGRFIMGLTTLTFISVIANVINTVDFQHRILSGSFERLFALITPLLFVYLLIFFIIRRK